MRNLNVVRDNNHAVQDDETTVPQS